MSVVTKFNHTRMRVNDLERTVDFYKTILGLEEVRRHTSPRGSQLAFLKAPESEELIEITCYPDSGSVEVQEDLMHLAFEVDCMDQFRKHIESHGVQFSDGPTQSGSGTTFAFIDAPEGYEIELLELPEE